jgi:hypothetical protein
MAWRGDCQSERPLSRAIASQLCRMSGLIFLIIQTCPPSARRASQRRWFFRERGDDRRGRRVVVAPNAELGYGVVSDPSGGVFANAKYRSVSRCICHHRHACLWIRARASAQDRGRYGADWGPASSDEHVCRDNPGACAC